MFSVEHFITSSKPWHVLAEFLASIHQRLLAIEEKLGIESPVETPVEEPKQVPTELVSYPDGQAPAADASPVVKTEDGSPAE